MLAKSFSTYEVSSAFHKKLHHSSTSTSTKTMTMMLLLVTAMANAQKPTPRTRHMDIRYFALSEWVERDLLALERVDTSMNMADHFSISKQLINLYTHSICTTLDHILGHVPPPYSPQYHHIAGSINNYTTHKLHTPSNIHTIFQTFDGIDIYSPQFVEQTHKHKHKLVSAWAPIIYHLSPPR